MRIFPLRTNAGQLVRDAADWRARRRPELLELFAREVYDQNTIELRASGELGFPCFQPGYTQGIREQAGLVHAIDAQSWNPGSTGLFCVSFNCDAPKRVAATTAIERELARCARRGFGSGHVSAHLSRRWWR